MSEICEQFHRLAREQKRYRFPFVAAEIPLNGIYVLFEKGEEGHQGERIVRIGSHTGDDNLPSRLKEHFINENKDRSIFRKNIGRALLNRDGDPFLTQWNYDLTSRTGREKYGPLIDRGRQQDIEQQVTRYICQNLSFCVFPVKEKALRLNMEAMAIATISKCNDCRASEQWLGRFSPLPKISKSGLWQVQHLEGRLWNTKDLAELDPDF